MRILPLIYVALPLAIPVFLTAPEIASACAPFGTCVNNGLAPPNPENFIDNADIVDSYFIRNVGCGEGPDPVAPCLMPGDPTTVEFVSTPGQALVRDSSEIRFTSGFAGTLTGLEEARITVNGGQFEAVNVKDATVAEIYGGVIDGPLDASGQSRIVLGESAVSNGPNLVTLRLNDQSTCKFSAGSIELLRSTDSSIFRGTVPTANGGIHGVLSSGDSHVFLSDGRYGLEGEVFAGGSSSLVVADDARFSDEIVAGDDATVLIANSGRLPNALISNDNAVIEIFGSGFAIDGIPAPAGIVADLQGDLTGFLPNGDPIDLFFLRGRGRPPGDILLTVPEPTIGALGSAGIAALLLLGRRRTRR